MGAFVVPGIAAGRVSIEEAVPRRWLDRLSEVNYV